MSSMRTNPLTIWGLALVFCAGEGAIANAATSTPECRQAWQDGQLALDANKLVEARAKYRICAQPICGDSMPDACSRRVGELSKRIPTVVFAAHRGDEQLTEVEVRVDGAVAATRLGGVAMAIDPGKHEFVFTVGAETVTVSRVVVEGQAAQHVDAVFPAQSVAKGAAPAVSAPGATPPRTEAKSDPVTSPSESLPSPSSASPRASDAGISGSHQKTAGIAMAIGGVVLGGVGGLLAYRGNDQYNHPDDFHGVCDSTCQSAQASAKTTTRVGVGLGFVGLAVATTGVVLWLTAPSAAEGPVVKVGVSPGAVELRVTF